MGAGASVNLESELQKPRDGSDVATPRGESAKNEVIRLRQMLFSQQRTERLKCAVMGGMLCDAVSSTLLWHYDVEKLKELVGDKEPFFFPKEHLCPYLKPMVEAGHYDKPSSLSPFGEQNLMFIDTMKDVDKTADIDGQAQSDVYYSWAKDFKGYKEMNVKVFEAAYSEGKKYPDIAPNHIGGEQAEMLGKGALCALKYRDQPKEFQEKQCRAFTLVSHSSKWVLELAVLQMKMILLLAEGKSVSDALDQALAECDGDMQSESNPGSSSLKELAAHARANLCKTGTEMYKMMNEHIRKDAWKAEISKAFPAYHPPEESMDDFAKATCINCFAMNGFIISISILLQTTDWKEAMKLSIMTGGDSAGRGLFLGSCLGAINGSLPTDLAAAWEGRAEIQKKVDACANN